jgi:SAM-dependent methyltransferase
MNETLPGSPVVRDIAPRSDLRARAFNASEFFRVPLVDMGSVERPDMAGIYMPEPEIGKAPIGLTDQFLEDADVYHRKYINTEYFKLLISDAMNRIGFRAERPAILDIGSGSGNSVFPCLELFPECRVVATDLSPNLLRILLDHVDRDGSSAGRVAPVCMDATRDYYAEGVFDLVVGAAILHHLIDPGAAIAAVSPALKPGGHAVFFEPFENGNAILRIAYAEILARAGPSERDAPIRRRTWRERFHVGAPSLAPRADDLADDVRGLLRAMVDDLVRRSGSDKSAPLFQTIDDKWLLTRSYVEEKARAAGFDEVLIYPIHDVERPYSRQTEVNLSLGLGASPERMPAWAWEILDYYDRVFSLELKRDLLIEGCIILRKR